MMEIDWSGRKHQEWSEFLRQTPRANYLQSLPYARAVQDFNHKAVRVGIIRSRGGPVDLFLFTSSSGDLSSNETFSGGHCGLRANHLPTERSSLLNCALVCIRDRFFGAGNGSQSNRTLQN